TFIVDFIPSDGTVEFIWGSPFGNIFGFVIRTILLSASLVALIAAFCVVKVNAKFRLMKLKQESLPDTIMNEHQE
ncbi:MAG: hypothetical protein FWE42_04105, partial [Defluviitaleaceae bacterium]|nr:hypothetical protein [Defluviitaleaceae bacterium]